jgi:iron complex outermembrane recepter protein
MKLGKNLAFGCCIAALAMPAAALAQSAGNEAPATADEAQSGQNSGIADIIVTARKVSENAQSVPLSIVALDGNALADANVNNVQDLQSQVPNLILQTHPNDPQGLSLAMRGQKQVDLTLTLDTSVGVYVDGYYAPRPLGLRNGLIDVARVEVLRGPQGTLYGRNTTGGAIALYTNDPVDVVEGSVQGSYGNFNAWDVVGIVNVPLNDRLALRLVGQHNEHDGYGEDAEGRPLVEERGTYVRGKLKFDVSEGLTATLLGSYQNSSNSGAIVRLTDVRPPANDGSAVSDYNVAVLAVAAELGLGFTPANLATAQSTLESYIGAPPGNYWDSYTSLPQYSDTQVYNAGLDISAELSDTITLRSLTGFMSIDRRSQTDTDGSPFALIGGPRETQDEYYSQELQLLGDSGRLNWVAGLYYGNERGHDQTVSDTLRFISSTSPTVYDATVRNKSYAIFAQADYELLPSLRLTAGVRYSWDERTLISRNSNRTNPCVVPAPGFDVVTADPASRQCPREFVDDYSDPSWLLSLDYQVSPDVLVYAKYARGYRSGGRNFKGSNNIGTFIDFQPETVTEYEVGLKSYFLDRTVRFNLAAYYDDYSDVQKVATILLPGTSAFSSQTVNAAKARVQGFEADLVWRVTDNLSLNAAAGLVDGKYKEFDDLLKGDRSDEPFDVPEWSYNVGGRYSYPTQFGAVRAQVDYQWQDSFYIDPQSYRVVTFTQPSRGLLGARVSVEVDAWDTEFAVFGKNLTREEYLSSGAGPYESLGLNFAIVGEPRLFGVEVRKRF